MARMVAARGRATGRGHRYMMAPGHQINSRKVQRHVRAARKALAEKAKAEKDAACAAEKETKRREQRDAKQLQAMCNLMTTTLMTRLMSQMSPGAMKEILTDFTDSNREECVTE